jgi:hypothetical protein
MDHAVVPTEIRRKVLFGVEATYCVAGVEGDLVTVEVIQAPGLKPGARMRMTAAAVAEMELVAPRLDVDREVGLLLGAA